MPETAYNAYDPLQQAFLASIAKGETGSAGTRATYTGTGGADLSTATTDQYGFPQWGGVGNSHAAGIFQFQPRTWDTIAAAHGLNFGNPTDQAAGAWYDAQQVYTMKTGGDLSTDLQAGKFTSIQDALSSEWTSLQSGDLGSLISGGGLPDIGGGNPISADTSSGGSGGIVGWLEKEFARFGLLIVGGLVVIVALWYLLSQSTGVPSPGDVAKAGVQAAALAA